MRGRVNELLEETAVVLVAVAATILSLMILIVVGTVVLNISLSWGWAAFAAGIAFAVWAVLKIPVPRDSNPPPSQER